jgi:predicted amidohydrolase
MREKAEAGGPHSKVMRTRVFLLLCLLASSAYAQAPHSMGANTRIVRVAACQIFGIDGDPEGNFRRIEYALQSAFRDRADLAVFPETVIYGWASPVPGPTSNRIAALARKYNLMIAIGLAEKDSADLYDSAILVDRDGTILHKHRKINTIQNAMTPPYTRGRIEDLGVAESRLGRIAIIICSDMFKKEIIQAVAALQPDLLLIPNGTAIQPKHWPGHGENLRRLVAEIAQRIHAPVVAPNLVGMITNGRLAGWTYGGLTPLADARRNTLAVLRDRDAEVRVVEVPVGRDDSEPGDQSRDVSP